jgi:ATP-dependent DNA helicase RecG
MTANPVLKRISAGESVSAAFVRDASDHSLIGRTICALLNAVGGTIFCGVAGKHQIVGVPDDAQTLAHRVELQLKQEISPPALFTVHAVKLGVKKIIIVEVPRGLDQPYVFDGGVWLRHGKDTKPADIANLKALLRAKGDLPERWERKVSPSMTPDDLDHDEIRVTAREAEEAKRFKFSREKDDLLVLRDLSCYSALGFTQGGDVLFSSAPTRRHPQCRVQLLMFSGDKSGDTYDDNRWLSGPLVRVCRELLAAITASVPVRSVFTKGKLERLDWRPYDLEAIREGVVNAFVHRDYSAYSGGLKVSIYPSRIEIWNSGRLPSGLRPGDLGQEHPSILVNPDIAQVFYLRKLMERIGRGTEKIAKASRELGAPKPQWRDAPTGVTLRLYAAPAPASKSDHLNKRQRALLSTLRPEAILVLKEYWKRYGTEVTARQARRDLEDLERLGLLKRTGSARATSYRLNPNESGHAEEIRTLSGHRKKT